MTGVATATQAGGPVARCSACHAVIWFGLTAKGKRMPLDPTPVDDGNVVIERVDAVIGTNAEVALPRVRVLRKDDVVGRDTPRYVAHFVRCPAADRFRRPAAKAVAAP